MNETPTLAVIVFAFNEAKNIPTVLKELRQWLDANIPDSEVVFVDDGSTDDSFAVAAATLQGTRHKIVRNKKNMGIGAAIKSGFRSSNARYFTFMPADGQIAPEAVGTLFEEAKLTNADAVFSVYDHRDDGLWRHLLSWSVRSLILVAHGIRMRSDGPYLFQRDCFDVEKLRPDSFFLNFEFPIRAAVQKLRTSVVTIACRPRRSGVSKSSGLRTIKIIARDLVELRVRREREHW